VDAIKNTLQAAGSLDWQNDPWNQNPQAGALDRIGNVEREFLKFAAEDLLPKVMQFGVTEAPLVCRQYAMKLVNHFALSNILDGGPCAPLMNGGDDKMPMLQSYFQIIGTLARDEDSEVLIEVCRGMNHMVHSQEGYILIGNNVSVVLDFMLKQSQHPEYGIRLVACDFWSPVAHWPDGWTDGIYRLLDSLVPVLLRNMKYSDQDYMNMDNINDEQNEKDHEHDLKPRFHTCRGGAGGDDDDEAGQAAWGSEWTVRKAAAASLDALATKHQRDLLNIALPIIGEKMAGEDWEEQEVGVLAIGAIANGCYDAMRDNLPRVAEVLLSKCIHSRKNLLRSISCWCLL
jgi:transportin-1